MYESQEQERIEVGNDCLVIVWSPVLLTERTILQRFPRERSCFFFFSLAFFLRTFCRYAYHFFILKTSSLVLLLIRRLQTEDVVDFQMWSQSAQRCITKKKRGGGMLFATHNDADQNTFFINPLILTRNEIYSPKPNTVFIRPSILIAPQRAYHQEIRRVQ